MDVGPNRSLVPDADRQLALDEELGPRNQLGCLCSQSRGLRPCRLSTRPHTPARCKEVRPRQGFSLGGDCIQPLPAAPESLVAAMVAGQRQEASGGHSPGCGGGSRPAGRPRAGRPAVLLAAGFSETQPISLMRRQERGLRLKFASKLQSAVFKENRGPCAGGGRGRFRPSTLPVVAEAGRGQGSSRTDHCSSGPKPGEWGLCALEWGAGRGYQLWEGVPRSSSETRMSHFRLPRGIDPAPGPGPG